jgi:hypothetical protein
MFKHLFLLIFIAMFTSVSAQEKTFQSGETDNNGIVKGKKTDQEVYGEAERTYNRVMLVPFEPKMYMSGIDRDIAEAQGLSFNQIRTRMRFGLSEMMLMQAKTNTTLRVISMMHIDSAAMSTDLKYIYSSIGYKYIAMPVEEPVGEEKEAKPLDKLKGAFGKLVKKDEPKEKTDEEGSTGIKEGQIVTASDDGEKYMNTKVINPNMFTYLSTKYKTDVFLFINQLDIEPAASNQYAIASNSYKRKIKVHYTVFDLDGKQLYGGASVKYFSSRDNDMNNIIKKHFNAIAATITAKLPQAGNFKQEVETEKRESELPEHSSETNKY